MLYFPNALSRKITRRLLAGHRSAGQSGHEIRPMRRIKIFIAFFIQFDTNETTFKKNMSVKISEKYSLSKLLLKEK
jgi:hypothetical protein